MNGAAGGDSASFGPVARGVRAHDRRERHRLEARAVRSHGAAERIEARGDLHDRKRIEDFEGPSAPGRIGAAAGDAQASGGMRLDNPNGVEFRLSRTREGYALSRDGDAVFIALDRVSGPRSRTGEPPPRRRRARRPPSRRRPRP